jgi:hypothetical protein
VKVWPEEEVGDQFSPTSQPKLGIHLKNLTQILISDFHYLRNKKFWEELMAYFP